MDSRFLLVFVVAAGIILPGVANYWLGAAGHPALGSAVWVAGYGAMVLVVWWGWIRPLDLGGAGSGTER
jgi:hypothetical protein